MESNDFKNKYQAEFQKALNDLKTKGNRKRQIPNLLTASRLFSPFFIIPAAISGNLPLAGLLTMLFAATDGVDGFLARKWNVTSELGRNLDAFTDKIFAGTLLITLSFFNPMLLITLAFEGVIGAVNTLDAIKGNEPRTAIIGKIKTAFLSALIVSSFATAFINLPSSFVNGLFIATTLLQVSSTSTYINRYVENEKNKKTAVKKNDLLMDIETTDNLQPTKEKQLSNPNNKSVEKYNKDELEKLQQLKNVIISKEDSFKHITNKEQEKGFSKNLKK